MPIKQVLTDEELNTIVTKDECRLARKFNELGIRAFVNVVCDDKVRPRKVLEHMQFLRGVWTGATTKESEKGYYKRHRINVEEYDD